MAKLTVVTRDDKRLEIEAPVEQSVMESIRDAGIDELMAICGGCMSCATCHVYVDERYLSVVQPRSEDEEELLSSSDGVTACSRLSCQIMMSEALDGMTVTIAPE